MARIAPIFTQSPNKWLFSSPFQTHRLPETLPTSQDDRAVINSGESLPINSQYMYHHLIPAFGIVCVNDATLTECIKKRNIYVTKVILIVDDEMDVVVPIQFLMKQQGYSVITAHRGEDALDLIYKYKPDLVLLDIMLPGIDGWEVCEIVRLNPNCRRVKIIFLTAKGGNEEIAKGLTLGADAYITKPFSNTVLVATVNEIFD